MNNKSHLMFSGPETIGKLCFLAVCRVLTSLFFVFLGVTAADAVEDKIDPNFNVRIQTTSYGAKVVSMLKIQPDNKILASGFFNTYNGEFVRGLIRLHPNGELDATFDNNVLANSGYISNIVLQPDGKILLVGDNLRLNGENAPTQKMIRLNADGTPDAEFNFPFTSTPYDVVVDDHGKIVASGLFTVSENGVSVQRPVIRLNADGTHDASFSYQATQSAFGAAAINGKLIVIATISVNNIDRSVIYRLNDNGSIDNSFSNSNNQDIVYRRIIVQPNKKILVVSDLKILRLNEDGSADSAFQPINLPTTGGGSKIQLNSDGKITVATASPGMHTFTRYSSNGSPDASFSSFSYVYSVIGTALSTFAVQNDGSIIIGEDNSIIFTNQYNRNGFIRLSPNGARDTNFNSGGSGFLTVTPGRIRVIGVQADDKILIGGRFDTVGGALRSRFARLNADSTLDNTFAINMSTTGNYFSRFDDVYNIKSQLDGKIILTGNFDYYINGVKKANLVRLNPDGGIDPTFNFTFNLPDFFPPTGAGQNRFVVQPDGKIVVGTSKNGLSNAISTIRLNANGTLDNSFGTSRYDSYTYISIRDIAIQLDGKILIGGNYITTVGNRETSTSFLGRLKVDGTLDDSFEFAEETNVQTLHFRLLENNQIIVVKSGNNSVQRLNSDGSVDATFAAGGANGTINAMLILPNGKILLGGNFTTFNNQPRVNLVKLNADGRLDATPYAVNNEVLSLALDNQNRVLVGGSFTTLTAGNDQNVKRSYAARLLISAEVSRTRFDFDGDGRADFAVFNGATGDWSILGNQANNPANSRFGLNGDKAAPADFDGDGKADIAVYRPSEGVWYIMQSAAGFTAIRWGTPEDKPAAGDYDGDGKADVAVWRPSSGVWYILQSSDNKLSAVQFGQTGDIVLPSVDFDGDKRGDISVFRPSSGVFYWLASGSNNQFRAVQFGSTGDIPAIADYNGDGKADLTVFRPSNGIWYQYLTTPEGEYSFAAPGFGQNGDVPVPADYNGDGKTDIAVRRASVWHVLMSGQSYQAVTFGAATAQAVAATHVQ